MSASFDDRVSDLLADYVDDVAPLEALLARYAIAEDQVSDLLALADELREVLVEVSPAAAFVDRLYLELVGQGQSARSWWGRVQDMPPRYKLAAGIGGITLTAGVLFTLRSLAPRLSGYVRRTEKRGEIVA